METETETAIETETETERRLLLRNWLTQLQGLVSPKSVVQASRLEIQGRVDVAVLGLKMIRK